MNNPQRTLNLGMESKPCWLDKKLFPATLRNCQVEDGYIYFNVDSHPLNYRVPLEDPGMPRHVYAEDGFSVPAVGEALIGECTEWGYTIYWIVFDIEWFKALPIKHDGMDYRNCGLCRRRRPNQGKREKNGN